MAKVILHLGLPKTATTTLQKKVFKVLDEQGKINFLGKLIYVPEGKRNPENIISHSDLVGDYIYDINQREEIKNDINNMLNNEILNVISDEGIVCSYPVKDNVSIENKVELLFDLFEGHEVIVLISIREQSSYIYSLYLQFYQSYYHLDRKRNTFKKFLKLLTKSEFSEDYEIYSQRKIIESLDSRFKTKLVNFDWLKNDQEKYIHELSSVLNCSLNSITLTNENEKKIKSGKVVTSGNFLDIVTRIASFTKNINLVHGLLSKLYRALNLGVVLDRAVPLSNKYHDELSEDIRLEIEDFFKDDTKYLLSRLERD